jgi:superfamily II DNA/RNA helicase
VFNFDVPFHPDDYVHRIGRTGRAGRVGHTYMLVTPRDEKQVSAIEHLTKTTIARRVMTDIEVREDRKPRQDERGGRGGRNGGRDRNRKDRFRPDKFHDHVAAMEPVAAVEAPAQAEVVVRAPEQPRHERHGHPRQEQARHEQPRQHQDNKKNHEPRRDQHKPREQKHKAHQDRKNDATPVKPEKHELPAFLFRPVNLPPKKADA